MTDPGPVDGEMTSASLLGMARSGAERRLGRRFDSATVGKDVILSTLCERLGMAAAFDLGLEVRDLPSHPLLSAVTRAVSPVEVVERWLRIERFGHSRNRTRIVNADLPGKVVTMQHYAIDGGSIDVRSDLFVWGVFVGLWTRALVRDVAVELPQRDGDPVALHAQQSNVVLGEPTLQSATATLRWGSVGTLDDGLQHPPGSDQDPGDSSIVARLRSTFERDLARGWKVAEVARALGQSPRQLQRLLRAADSTFTDVLHRSRADAARELISTTRLSLVEIAFCTGFADAAHLSRVFRRLHEVPPSTFRELVDRRRDSTERTGR